MTLQPDSDRQDRTLVEREGVNAGSDASTVEGDREMISPQVASHQLIPQHDDTSARPTSAGDENGSGRVAEDGHAVGAPATVVGAGHDPQRLDQTADSALAPETDAVESGQDNGSMS